MAQIIVTFVADHHASALAVAKQIFREEKYSVSIEELDRHYDYIAADVSATEAMTRLVADASRSLVLRFGGRASLRYIMFRKLDFKSSSLPAVIVCDIEYASLDFEWIWQVVLGSKGIKLVGVGFEESVEFNGDQMSDSRFPWDDWFLVVAAVREETKQGPRWIVRTGPAYTREANNAGWRDLVKGWEKKA